VSLVNIRSLSGFCGNIAASFFSEKAGAPFGVRGVKNFFIRSNSDDVSF